MKAAKENDYSNEVCQGKYYSNEGCQGKWLQQWRLLKKIKIAEAESPISGALILSGKK